MAGLHVENVVMPAKMLHLQDAMVVIRVARVDVVKKTLARARRKSTRKTR